MSNDSAHTIHTWLTTQKNAIDNTHKLLERGISLLEKKEFPPTLNILVSNITIYIKQIADYKKCIQTLLDHTTINDDIAILHAQNNHAIAKLSKQYSIFYTHAHTLHDSLHTALVYTKSFITQLSLSHT